MYTILSGKLYWTHQKTKTECLEEGSVVCKYIVSCKKQCMVCKQVAACELEEEAAHSGMKPSVFPKRGTISLKRMCHDLHCHITKLYGLPVCISLPMLSAYLSCLLLVYILASEASCGSELWQRHRTWYDACEELDENQKSLKRG